MPGRSEQSRQNTVTISIKPCDRDAIFRPPRLHPPPIPGSSSLTASLLPHLPSRWLPRSPFRQTVNTTLGALRAEPGRGCRSEVPSPPTARPYQHHGTHVTKGVGSSPRPHLHARTAATRPEKNALADMGEGDWRPRGGGGGGGGGEERKKKF
ncbi:hypothetical protein O3P69_009423 [Scylla paramamosain]|uniref:Uncharacterized protein n=1 Tax=Scylla paramamosain TaxID=85552 RepID=A0AAW0SVG6_SCYPA